MSSTHTVKFSGRSLAKGRNGLFGLVEAEVWKYAGRVRVEFYSRTRGDSPPISFELEPAEMNRLIAAMRAAADEEG